MVRSLSPQKMPQKLAPTPSSKPKYAVELKDQKGGSVVAGDPRATRALVALMNQHAVIGGAAAHWGGPAAFAEIMSAAHALMFQNPTTPWYEQFNFVNDAGHTENGIYALRANYGFDGLEFKDLKGFRSIKSKLTGHGEAHLNPEGVLISNGPLGSGVPQAQGLCFADRLSGNQRLTLCTLSDGGAMEGETREALAAIPGLAQKNKMNPFVLVISDNNTKLSGRIEQDSYSMTPTFQSLSTLGWELSFVEEGHDLQKVFTAIEDACEKARSNPNRPRAVVVKTLKGYGVKSTVESASGGHGYPLKAYDEKLVEFVQEIYNGNAPEEFTNWAREILKSKPQSNQNKDDTPRTKVQNGVARACIDQAKLGLPLLSISADLQGSTGIAPFHKEFPERTLDVGVAESNMISTAVGLSKMGYLPIVDTFAQFGITKGKLPLIMSGLSQAPVIGLFSHTGFQDAADGASHQATTYFSAMAAIPYTVCVSLSCEQAAYDLMGQGLQKLATDREQGKAGESQLYFFGRETHPVSYVAGVKYEWGKPLVLRQGTEATVVATGPMVEVAMNAAATLSAEGIELSVIDHSFINRPDVNVFKSELSRTHGRLITLEDHQVIAGMGSQLTHALALAGVDFKVQSLGIPGVYGQSAYLASELYEQYGLSEKGIRQALDQWRS
jgi:transketolase